MDPKAVERIQREQAAMAMFVKSIDALNTEYLMLMARCGVKRIPLHRF